MDQAKFFFTTTLKHCGNNNLPALLGMAVVHYSEGDFLNCQRKYATAIRLYPYKSGAACRVGFGLACYKLGQIGKPNRCCPIIVCRRLFDWFFFSLYHLSKRTHHVIFLCRPGQSCFHEGIRHGPRMCGSHGGNVHS